MGYSKDNKLTYEVKETIISVNDGSSEWNLELNLVSWNNREAKYDLRKWSPDHTSMGKGVTMSEDEVILLFQKSDELLDRFRDSSDGIVEADIDFH